MPSNSHKVLVIFLDAAEHTLVEQWMAEGCLPHLAALRRRGAYGVLGQPVDELSGLAWPTFYTARTPGWHGAYHYIQWQPSEGAAKRIASDWLPLNPFWRRLGPDGPFTVAVDVPLAPSPSPFHGIELAGWASHEILVDGSHAPRGLLAEIQRRFGRPPAHNEPYGLRTPAELLAIRQNQIDTAHRIADLALFLMENQPWELFMVSFSPTHRGGHKFWGLSGAFPPPEGETRAILENALKDIYVACDQAVGRLVARAGEGVHVLVASMHGMGPNHSRTEVLPLLLERILAVHLPAVPGRSPIRRLIRRLRALLPESWRYEIKSRLPFGWQDWLTTHWRMDRNRISAPVLNLPADFDGYLQVNLRGREKHGVVDPGADYERWLEIVDRGLRSFVDADNGQPIVRAVLRREQLGFSGDQLDKFPDLTVKWQATLPVDHRLLVSERYGQVPWPTPGYSPSGRSGNHRPQGFLFATGTAFSPGSVLEQARVVDVAPTILYLLGLPPFPEMDGRVLHVD
jgi:predicted AlkP superfamily phosphohydrolase/phosphomutase